MKEYEAMVILPEMMNDEQVEKALDGLKKELQGLGGDLLGATRLGRKSFARKMDKQSAGEYALVKLTLPPDQLLTLHKRVKLAGEIFRMQIICAPAVAAPEAGAA